MKFEQLKVSPSTKIATADKVTTKSTRNCQMLRSLWQNKNN